MITDGNIQRYLNHVQNLFHLIIIFCLMSDLKSLAPLGQGWGLQVANLLAAPTHEVGRGLLQLRSQVSTPPPQVLARRSMWMEIGINNRKPWARRRGSPFAPVPGFLLVAGVRELLLFTLFLLSFVFLIKLLIKSYFHLTCHIRMWSPPLAALTETIECRIQSEGATGQYRLVFEGVLVFAAVLIYVMFNLRDPSQSQLPTWWGPLSRRGGDRCILYLNLYLYF